MRFSKYNNPNKRRARKRLSTTEADIIATKNMLDDRRNGIEMPLDIYEWQSKKMQGKEWWRMRLIDADKLIDYFYYGIDDKPIIDGISDRKIIDIIKNQPTDYDVYKVVEELETDSSVKAGKGVKNNE